jgi:hypothetical protein
VQRQKPHPLLGRARGRGQTALTAHVRRRLLISDSDRAREQAVWLAAHPDEGWEALLALRDVFRPVAGQPLNELAEMLCRQLITAMLPTYEHRWSRFTSALHLPDLRHRDRQQLPATITRRMCHALPSALAHNNMEDVERAAARESIRVLLLPLAQRCFDDGDNMLVRALTLRQLPHTDPTNVPYRAWKTALFRSEQTFYEMTHAPGNLPAELAARTALARELEPYLA